MSATGLDVFDKTVQTTNIWLDEIMARLGPDRHLAWHVLGAVLRALRDRLPLDEAAHLGAQLPLLVRGLYYSEWHPAAGIRTDRHQEEFLAHVGEGLDGARPVNVKEAVRTVFRVLRCAHRGGPGAKSLFLLAVRDPRPVACRRRAGASPWREAGNRGGPELMRWLEGE